MRFGEIDIPQEIISDLEAGRLVIFAGAGVSSPSPSSLPLFGKLADRLAEGTRLSRHNSETDHAAHGTAKHQPIDRFLGRLVKDGVNVKERTRDILIGDHTKPNALHAAVAKLFCSPENLRIVTTNFDTHFSTVITDAFNGSVEIYQAPALPLGSDFTGLVYLHGCAEHSARHCVLTDEDFGKAYLTEGWARRFLVSMFQNFTVLFIGYSHDDPVMNYLARGLPPATRHRRFAIAASGREPDWEFLDIHPCTYAKRTCGDEHGALAECLGKWSAHSQTSFLDRFHRVRGVAEGVPPKDPEEQDFVIRCMTDEALQKQFVERARSEEWLLWLAEKGLLKKLFQRDLELSNSDQLYAWWVARLLIPLHTPTILRISLEYDAGCLHPSFCSRIAGVLWALKEDAKFRTVFRQWTCVLLAQKRNCLTSGEWAHLLLVCNQDDDLPLVPMLFERATELAVGISKPWSLASLKNEETTIVTIDVDLHQDVEYSLREAWKSCIAPNLPKLAKLLEPIVAQRLASIHLIAKASGGYDKLNFRRHSIEPHDQDQYPDDLDIFIDILRDLIAFFQRTEPAYADALIVRWMSHEAPVLVRLAVHALARQPTISADQKIERCIEYNLLFSFPAKTEVFFVLKSAYRDTSRDLRIKLLDLIEKGPQGLEHEGFSAEDRSYLAFQRIGWLSQTDVSCAIAADRLARIQTLHANESLGPHPDLHSWTSNIGFHSPDEGQDLDVISQRPPIEFLERVRNAGDSARFEDRRMNLVATIAILVTRRFEWGLEIQQLMRKAQIADEDIWTYICQGWRDSKLEANQWPALLAEFHESNTPIQFYRSIIDTLEAWTRKDAKQPPHEYWDSLDQLALKAWDIALSKDTLNEDTPNDWVFLAINRPGGKYAEYLFTRLEQNRKAGIKTDHLFTGIAKALRCSSGAAELAALLIASQIRWFCAIAPDLARVEIMPRFDWSRDAKQAEQAWQGFLQSGHWTPELAEELKDSFAETVKRLGTGKLAERIGGHLASLCFWLYEDPLADNWLYTAIGHLAPAARVKFAIQIRRCLKEASEAKITDRWDRWISLYWSSRNRGAPPLLDEEACYMVGWALYAGPKSKEAVHLATVPTTMASSGRFPVIHEIEESGMLDHHPGEAAKLLLMFLRNPPRWLSWDDNTKAVWEKLRHTDIDTDLLTAVREAFAKAIGVDPEESTQAQL